MSLARSCHPIGLINAGDIRGAVEDVREIGQLYNTANSRGILWAEVTVIAIAAATRPGATVDRVLSAVFDNCDRVDSRFIKPAGIQAELERALKLTADCTDVREMRRRFLRHALSARRGDAAGDNRRGSNRARGGRRPCRLGRIEGQGRAGGWRTG